MIRRVVAVAVALLVAGAIGLWRADQPQHLPAAAHDQPPTRPVAAAQVFPPFDLPLLWVQPPEDTSLDSLRLRASDWAGHDLGAVSLHCLAPCSVYASPNGQRLLVRPDGTRLVAGPGGAQYQATPAATVFDPAGLVIGSVEGTTGDAGSTWADDSRHLCVLRSPGTSVDPRTELDLVNTDDDSRRTVVHLALPPPPPSPALGIQAWDIAACSTTSDRAVLIESSTDGVGGIEAVQLSTGAVLYRREDRPASGGPPPPLFPVAAVTVSPDGSLAAEQLASGVIQLRDLDSGAVIPWPGGPQLEPSSVSSLSWHGLRAVTDRGVVDLTTGRVVWRPLLASAISPQQSFLPGSDDVVVTVGGNEVVVRSDGSAVGLWAAFQLLGLPCDQLSSVMPLDRVIVLC